MVSPLKGPIAKIVGQALKAVAYPITLRRTTSGGYVPGGGDDAGTVTDYRCLGFVDSYGSYEVAMGLVQPADRKVLILSRSLSIAPSVSTDDLIIDGKLLSIISMKSDPAGATWEMQCR